VTTATLPPTRTERLFGSAPVTEDDLLKGVEFDVVICPKCLSLGHSGRQMTCVKGPTNPLKDGKPTGFQTVTWQCHNRGRGPGEMCLMVVTTTDSVGYYMRPGDFDKGDIGWKDAVAETVPAADVSGLVTAKQVKVKQAFTGVPAKPIYPGTRATVNKQIWDYFWDHIMRDGKVSKKDLEAYVKSVATVAATKRDRQLATLTDWIPERTGYSVKLVGDSYEVTGKAARLGGKGPIGEPFSTPEYKKAHGFPI